MHQTQQPATPVRDGYDFTGWFTDKNASESTEFDFETMLVMGGLTLFAGWNETPVVEHTVSFDAQNG
ncbi:InlB B-repeat-containing protein, partial [Leucobacter sp. G161]|uniref:InlB B-repeat-containing protein n=1 Tax=Leucobacter sp. G161 TaxID=663704 RepID=UPI000AF64A20